MVRSVRLILLLAAYPAVAVAQRTPVAEAPAPTRYADAIARGRAMVDSLMAARAVPGLAVAVSVDGAVVWSEGFGFADVEQRVPVTPITKFRIGSISKSLTALALGLLYEQGKLDLDAPVQQYVPSFPPKPKGTVTTRLLAGHLAGVRHYRGREFLLAERFPTVASGLGIFQDDTLLFAPGSRYSYSSYGWNLLSAVIEGASAESFLSYMRKNVIEPLGLRHTVADHTDSIIAYRTAFYDRGDDGVVRNAPYVDNSYKWAGGGYLSTPEDLVRFANAHLEGVILQPETVRLWWTSQRNVAGEETGYGMGWSVGTYRGLRTVGHGGGSIGGNCQLVVFPDQGVVVAITANTGDVGYRDVPQRIGVAFIETPR